MARLACVLLCCCWLAFPVAARRLGLDGDPQCCVDAAATLQIVASHFPRVHAWLASADKAQNVTGERRELTYETPRGTLPRLPR